MNCPICRKPLNTDRSGVRCSCGYFVSRIIRGKIVSDTHFELLFSKGKTPFIRGFHKRGSDELFASKLILKGDGRIGFLLEEKSGLSCPSCGKLLLENSNSFNCSADKCHFSLNKKIGGVKLSDSELKSLLIFGETEPIHRFISPKTGSNYSATIFFDENYSPKFKKI